MNSNENPMTSSPLKTPVDKARRESLVSITMAAAALLVGARANSGHAFSFADLTQKDASAGVKAALERGADIAVQLLGKQDGFWGNDKVRIPLPDWIGKAERALKMIGKGRDIDDLKLGINRAAEQAVPQAKKLLSDAVKSMTVQDAKAILTGGDNSVTEFFKSKTEKPLNDKFLPIVSGVTDRIGLAKQYNGVAAQIEQTGLVKLKPEQRKVETHVTAKALDGLYYMIGEEEKKIRKDPVGAGSDILRRVFGAVR
jgi:hypothetical protein